MAEADPRIHCLRCKCDVVWPAGFSDKEKYALATKARGSPTLAIRQVKDLSGLAFEEAKMLVTHVTRQYGKCQLCRADVPRGAAVCAVCGAANLNW